MVGLPTCCRLKCHQILNTNWIFTTLKLPRLQFGQLLDIIGQFLNNNAFAATVWASSGHNWATFYSAILVTLTTAPYLWPFCVLLIGRVYTFDEDSGDSQRLVIDEGGNVGNGSNVCNVCRMVSMLGQIQDGKFVAFLSIPIGWKMSADNQIAWNDISMLKCLFIVWGPGPFCL